MLSEALSWAKSALGHGRRRTRTGHARKRQVLSASPSCSWPACTANTQASGTARLPLSADRRKAFERGLHARCAVFDEARDAVHEVPLVLAGQALRHRPIAEFTFLDLTA
jgi:hypothetical protein